MNTQKGFVNILIIILGLLIVVGVGYFYFSYINIPSIHNELTENDNPPAENVVNNFDDNDTTEENNAFYIKVLRPNGGENISYGSIVMAGDLMIEWSSNYDSYSPTERAEIFLIDDSGSIVRKDKVHYSIASNHNDSFVSSLVGEEGIELDTKYKIMLCDEIDGMVNCDTSDDFFYVVRSSPDNSNEYSEEKPVVDNVSPTSGPVGTEIIITGQNLSGFEGDHVVHLERFDGNTVTILAKTSYDNEKIVFDLIEWCPESGKVMGPYSGAIQDCEYVKLIPGTYKLYVAPWGNKSNEIQFEIIKSSN